MPITVAQNVVIPSAKAVKADGIAAVAIAIGQTLYRLANGKMGLAIANGTDLENTVAGIAVTSAAADGQPVEYVVKDSALGMAECLYQGKAYFQSQTAGGIDSDYPPVSTRTTLLGVAVTANILNFSPVAGGSFDGD